MHYTKTKRIGHLSDKKGGQGQTLKKTWKRAEIVKDMLIKTIFYDIALLIKYISNMTALLIR